MSCWASPDCGAGSVRWKSLSCPLLPPVARRSYSQSGGRAHCGSAVLDGLPDVSLMLIDSAGDVDRTAGERNSTAATVTLRLHVQFDRTEKAARQVPAEAKKEEVELCVRSHSGR